MTNFSALTDEQLVRAYAKGNNEAFDTLLRRHQDRIFSYILRIIKNEDIANDIFQETFVKAIQTIRLGRYTRKTVNSPAWISRIAHNLIIDYYRQEKVRKSSKRRSHRCGHTQPQKNFARTPSRT